MRKNRKNPKFRKWVKIDPKVNRVLKSRPRCQFSIPNAGFSISTIFSEIFNFFQNFLDFRHFLCVKILWTPNRNCSKFVRNLDFGSKTILQSFRMTKIDHIPYPDHNFWMKIDCCGIWFLTPMDFHVFYTFCTVFLYWPLQSPLWGPFRRKKLFFRKSIISPRDVGISTECSEKVRWVPKDIPLCWYGHILGTGENIPILPNVRILSVRLEKWMVI